MKSLSISPSLDEILTYPKPVPRKTSQRGQEASKMPSHLTSDQVIQFLEEKKRKKQEEEDEKVRKRADREAQRERKRVERELKIAEREHKRAEKEAAKGRARGRGSKGRGKSRVSTRSQTRSTQPATASTSNSTNGSDNESDDCVLCPNCGEGDETRLWVRCDSVSCKTWYHVECTHIDPEEYNDLDAITWFCDNCC